MFIGSNPFEHAKDTVYENLNLINGLSFSLMGTMLSQTGSNGISLNPIGSFYNQVNGLQVAGFINMAGKTNGATVSGVFNVPDQPNGVQIAFANSSRTLKGVQLGVANEAGVLRGVQAGLFNFTKHARGIQLGLWNANEKRRMPLINWNFSNPKARH